MKVFEIPEVFGKDCDEKCAQTFTDCLIKDARNQIIQESRKLQGKQALQTDLENDSDCF